MKKRVFELAYELRQLKLWKQFAEHELFAFEYGGETYYASIMGAMGEHFAFAFYRGISGLMGLRDMVTAEEGLSYYEISELGMQQDCLMCSYVCKLENNYKEQVTDYSKYCKEKGLRISGANSYPMFESFKPYRVPKPIAKDDEAIMEYALEVVKARTEFAVSTTLPDVPFYDGNSWEIRELPDLPETPHPVLKTIDEFTARRIAKNKNGQTWLAKMIMLPSAVGNEDDAYFPLAVMLMDAENGFMPEPIVENDGAFDMNGYLTKSGVPSRIIVFDERTEVFLKDYMRQIGVPVEFDEEDDEFEECLEEMIEGLADPGLAEMRDMLKSLVSSKESISEIPDEVLIGSLEMLGPLLPDELFDELIKRGLIEED